MRYTTSPQGKIPRIKQIALSALGLLIAFVVYKISVIHYTPYGVMPLANFLILTGILSFGMALFTIVRSPKRTLAVLWALTCVVVGSWSFGFGMLIKAQSFAAAMAWQKWVLYPGAIFIPIVYVHFVKHLVEDHRTGILPVGYGIATLFAIANASGNLVTLRIKPPFQFYAEAIFPFFHAFAMFFLALTVYAHWLLFDRMKTTEGKRKTQIQYVFIGTAVGFLGGSMSFPLCFDIPIFPTGCYLVAIYIIAVSYAMYKHQLMDIQLVLRKSLIYSLMTGILSSVYLIAITQGGHILQNYFGGSTLTVSIIVACFISAIFLPLRERIQNLVDRYFFRDWADRETVREVAAGFSHELKSPLAGLSLQVQQTLVELEDLESGRGSMRQVLPKIRQDLSSLLDKTMDAARRIEAVRGVAEPAGGTLVAVSVPEVLASSLVILGPLVARVGAEVSKSIPGDLALVRSDPKQLEIVFINLMKNALEAMEEEPLERPRRLLLGAKVEGGSVLVTVSDTGPGIPPKDVGHLFEPYHTTKGRKGTGMGLYLSQQIVKAHGGLMEVKSEEGKGTEFRVTLQACVSGANPQNTVSV